MKIWFNAFVIAMQFMTRIPMPNLDAGNDEERRTAQGYSMLFYPLVGLVIGFILFALTHFLLALTSYSHAGLLVAAIVLLGWVALSGALHIDGLADSADAWLGGFGDKQRTLEIMKDPVSGPAGVTAIVLLLIVKFSAIYALIETSAYALVMAPILGRTMVLLLFVMTPYVRKGGIGTEPAANLPAGLARWVVLGSCGILFLNQSEIFFALVAVLITYWFVRRLMIKRIDGTTGDTAGAMIEISETVFLVALVLSS